MILPRINSRGQNKYRDRCIKTSCFPLQKSAQTNSMNIYSLYNEYIHFITLLYTHDNTVCIDILNHLQEISRVEI